MHNPPNLEQIQALLLDHVATSHDQPFGPDVIVFRVCHKMYALLAWQQQPMRLNLKCDPLEAEMQRSQYPAILPGYHMNKKHWNTVMLDGSLSIEFIAGLIEDSYRLVVSGLRKAERDALTNKQK